MKTSTTPYPFDSFCICCGEFSTQPFCSEVCRHAYQENVEEYLAAADRRGRFPVLGPVESRPDLAGLDRAIRGWLDAFKPAGSVKPLPADPQDERYNRPDDCYPGGNGPLGYTT